MATVRKYLCRITEGANKVSVVVLLIAATVVGCLASVQNEGTARQPRRRFEEGSFKTLPPLKLRVRKANYKALLPLELRRSKKIAIEESKARYSEIRRIDNRYCKKLTNHKADDLAADISPDSRKVVFPSERDENTEVYIADLEAKTIMNISNNLMSDEGPKFFGDDSRVVFQSNRDGNWEVYLMRLTE